MKAEITNVLDDENVLYIREHKLWPPRFAFHLFFSVGLFVRFLFCLFPMFLTRILFERCSVQKSEFC